MDSTDRTESTGLPIKNRTSTTTYTPFWTEFHLLFLNILNKHYNIKDGNGIKLHWLEKFWFVAEVAFFLCKILSTKRFCSGFHLKHRFFTCSIVIRFHSLLNIFWFKCKKSRNRYPKIWIPGFWNVPNFWAVCKWVLYWE